MTSHPKDSSTTTQAPSTQQAVTADSSMSGSAETKSSHPTRTLNYDGVGRFTRYILTTRPLKREQLNFMLIPNSVLVKFLGDNNVQVPSNLNRASILNKVENLIKKNPMLPQNYQTCDREKDKHKYDHSEALFTKELSAFDAQLERIMNKQAQATPSTSSTVPQSPSTQSLPTNTLAKDKPNLITPAVPASNAVLHPDSGSKNGLTPAKMSRAALSYPTSIGARGGLLLDEPRPRANKSPSTPPQPSITSAPPSRNSQPVQYYLPGLNSQISFISKRGSLPFSMFPQARMSFSPTGSCGQSLAVAVPPKQKPLPPLVPPAGAPLALQPQGVANNGASTSRGTSKASGQSSHMEGAAPAADDNDDAKDVEVITLDDGSTQQGCEAVYLIELTEDSEDWEVLPPCKCEVTLQSLIKQTRFPKEFIEYLESKVSASVEALVKELTDFGQGPWARTTGCRLLLLKKLRDQQVKAHPGLVETAERVEVVDASAVASTGVKREAAALTASEGESGSQEAARKRRRLQEKQELVVWPKEYKPMDTVLVTRGEDFTYITEMMNKTSLSNGRQVKLNCSIEQIERVWNEKAYRRYINHLELIREENDGVLHEFHLFHGSARCREIAQQGFDERLSKTSGMFGAGLYFAEDAIKSNNYSFGVNGLCPSHRSQTCTKCVRQLLLCRVALGKMSPQQQAAQFSHPPPGHHSVQGLAIAHGGTLKFPEYVVYRGEQAYPEFLITYKMTK